LRTPERRCLPTSTRKLLASTRWPLSQMRHRTTGNITRHGKLLDSRVEDTLWGQWVIAVIGCNHGLSHCRTPDNCPMRALEVLRLRGVAGDRSLVSRKPKIVRCARCFSEYGEPLVDGLHFRRRWASCASCRGLRVAGVSQRGERAEEGTKGRVGSQRKRGRGRN